MRVDIEDFTTGWFGLTVGLTRPEIDAFIQRLIAIRDDPSGHFHFRSNYEGSGGVGDIEFYVRSPEEPNNMSIE
jgi:hypothetical protein